MKREHPSSLDVAKPIFAKPPSSSLPTTTEKKPKEISETCSSPSKLCSASRLAGALDTLSTKDTLVYLFAAYRKLSRLYSMQVALTILSRIHGKGSGIVNALDMIVMLVYGAEKGIDDASLNSASQAISEIASASEVDAVVLVESTLSALELNLVNVESSGSSSLNAREKAMMRVGTLLFGEIMDTAGELGRGNALADALFSADTIERLILVAQREQDETRNDILCNISTLLSQPSRFPQHEIVLIPPLVETLKVSFSEAYDAFSSQSSAVSSSNDNSTHAHYFGNDTMHALADVVVASQSAKMRLKRQVRNGPHQPKQRHRPTLILPEVRVTSGVSRVKDAPYWCTLTCDLSSSPSAFKSVTRDVLERVEVRATAVTLPTLASLVDDLKFFMNEVARTIVALDGVFEIHKIPVDIEANSFECIRTPNGSDFSALCSSCGPETFWYGSRDDEVQPSPCDFLFKIKAPSKASVSVFISDTRPVNRQPRRISLLAGDDNSKLKHQWSGAIGEQTGWVSLGGSTVTVSAKYVGIKVDEVGIFR